MKQFLGTLLIIGTSIANLSAQRTNEKQVVIVADGATKQPLAAATVVVNNYNLLSKDDGSCTFSIAKGSSKSIKIIVSNIGYSTLDTTVSLSSNKTIVYLQPTVFFLQPLEIKALRASSKMPFTKTNISKAQLEKINIGQDLPFIINQTPSVVVSSDAGNGVGYTYMNIRGSDASRINVTLNGIPFNDAESQGTFFVNMPDFVSSVNSIQIQRGAGTSSNGTGAFGASVNLSTNEYNEKPYAEINNSVGSFNTWKNTVKAGTGLINNHFTVDARVSQITSDGFIDRASSNLQSFAVQVAYLNKKTSIRYNIFSGKEKTYQAWYGIAENLLQTNRKLNVAGTEKPSEPYNNETDNYTQVHHQLFINHQISNTLSFNSSFFYTLGNGYYEQYKANQKFSRYGLPNFSSTITRTDLVRQLWLDNKFYGQLFSLHYKKNIHQITIGGGWNTYEGDHFGNIIWANVGIPNNYQWYNTPALKKDANLYTKWEMKLGKNFTSLIDIQYRNVKHTMNGFRDNTSLFINRNFNFVNPKFGITYSKNNWQAYTSFAVAQKEPNRNDFETGTINQPKAEQLQNIEVGTEYKTSKAILAANFYFMHYNNQLILNGMINDVGAYTRINVPKSHRIGVEMQASYIFNNWLQANANLTLSQNKIQAFTEFIDNYDNGLQNSIQHTNTNIAFSPNIVSSNTITIKPSKNIECSFIGKYVGKQFLDNTQNNNRSLDAFYTQDIRCIYTLKNKIFKEWNIIAQVNNIFNEMYEPNGYTFSYIVGGQLTSENFYFPMAGTNVMVAVNIKL